MIFSVIEIETFKRCRRKWDLQSDNRQNLEAIRHAAALTLGTLVHETLALKTDEPETNLVATFADKAAVVMENIEDTYKAAVGTKMDIDEATPTYEAINLGVKLMQAYNDYYKIVLPPHYKPVHAEQRMIVAIPGTEHFLRGTIDELVQDIRNGKLYPLERKTYAVRPKKEKLQDDTQMIAYEWMLCQLFGWDNIGGTLYDGIWKRDPTTKYFKSHYQLSDLFFRQVFIHPRHQLEEYGHYLPAIVNEMATVQASDLYYNRRWEGCYDCGVKELCDALSRDEDFEFVRDNFFRQRRDDARFVDPESTNG